MRTPSHSPDATLSTLGPRLASLMPCMRPQPPKPLPIAPTLSQNFEGRKDLRTRSGAHILRLTIGKIENSPRTDPLLATPEFCYECFQTSPDHRPRDCPDYGHCFFCTSNQHESLTCISPHLHCQEFECIVPSWHNHHGSICSAKPAARILRLMRFWPTEALQKWDAEPDVLSSPSDGEISEEV
jgi:hypothetical protein